LHPSIAPDAPETAHQRRHPWRRECQASWINWKVPPSVPKSVLTQNLHLTPSTQQAERSWLNTRNESWKRASQFSWNWQRK
jgi:hypothetical protein